MGPPSPLRWSVHNRPMVKDPAHDAHRSSSMPQRPRQHELESASVRAFSSMLPPSWTDQPRTDDYGIDRDVEIFENGSATGLRFGVQLKSVESVKRNPSVRIRLSTLQYWRSQADPVLLLLWDASTGRAWSIWQHQIDTYGLKPGAKAITVKFSEPHLWDDSTHAQWRFEVEAWRARAVSSRHLPLPLVCVGSGSIGPLSAGRIVQAVRRYARAHSRIFALGDKSSPLRVTVRIQPETTIVELSGAPSNVIHHENTPDIPSSMQPRIEGDMAATAMLAVAMQLHRVNLHSEAAHVIASIADDCDQLHGQALYDAIAILGLAGDYATSEKILDRARRVDPRGVFPGVMALALHSDSEGADAAALRMYSRWAEEEEARGHSAEAAREIYNCALYVGSAPARLALLEKSAALDPGYRLRDYWWKDLGGALFLCDRFEESATAYETAVKLGADPWVSRLRGDALLFAGRYADSLKELDEALVSVEARDAEYRLKARAFGYVSRMQGVEAQARSPQAARSVVFAEDHEKTEDPLRAIEAALRLDLLCAPALYYLGHHRLDAGERAVELLLSAALLDPTFPQLWLIVFHVVGEVEPDWYEDVVRCAKRFAGEQILDYLWERDEADLAEETRRLFDEIGPPDGVAKKIQFRSPVFNSGEYETFLEIGLND